MADKHGHNWGEIEGWKLRLGFDRVQVDQWGPPKDYCVVGVADVLMNRINEDNIWDPTGENKKNLERVVSIVSSHTRCRWCHEMA